MHHPTDWITHTTAFVIPVVEHWLEQEIAQWVHYKGVVALKPWVFKNTLLDGAGTKMRTQYLIAH